MGPRMLHFGQAPWWGCFWESTDHTWSSQGITDRHLPLLLQKSGGEATALSDHESYPCALIRPLFAPPPPKKKSLEVRDSRIKPAASRHQGCILAPPGLPCPTPYLLYGASVAPSVSPHRTTAKEHRSRKQGIKKGVFLLWLSLLSEDPNLPFPQADFYLSLSEYSGLAWPSGWHGGKRLHDRLHQQ